MPYLMRRTDVAVYLILAMCLFVGCKVSPDEGQLICTGDSDCPTGWVCDVQGDGHCYSDEALFSGGVGKDTGTANAWDNLSDSEADLNSDATITSEIPTDTDGEADSDRDTQADTGSDVDVYTDTDTDADMDADIDADSDTDTDSDSDADADTQSGGTGDADTDGDIDSSPGTDTISPTDPDTRSACQESCIFNCQPPRGVVVSGICAESSLICCQFDSDTGTSTDSEVDSDTGTGSDVETDDETDTYQGTDSSAGTDSAFETDTGTAIDIDTSIDSDAPTDSDTDSATETTGNSCNNPIVISAFDMTWNGIWLDYGDTFVPDPDGGCGQGDRDIWFSVLVPASSIVSIEEMTKAEVVIQWVESCASQSCLASVDNPEHYDLENTGTAAQAFYIVVSEGPPDKKYNPEVTFSN